ncbi:MAG: hypothetical protein HY879_13185 [Deltaproteobacteria bacterium]|nr:hypothetical protein [Deltaproteobacteria bacterium]
MENNQRLIDIEGVEPGVLVAQVEGLGGPGKNGAEMVVEERLPRRGDWHGDQRILRVGGSQRVGNLDQGETGRVGQGAGLAMYQHRAEPA